MEPAWDCIVVGGGAAGLSAALVLGRARQRTLVIDAGAPSNLVAHGIGGLLGHDGRPPKELYELGRRELETYPSVEVRSGVVEAGRRLEEGFEVVLADGQVERTRRVVLATGMDYRRPDVPGIEERWGGSVFHCPFCHGWEVRDRRIGVLDAGPTAVHRSLLLREWSDDVTIYSNGPAGIEPAEQVALDRAGVTVDERRVVELAGPDGTLTAIRFDGGEEAPCEGLMVPVTLHQRSTLATDLGATTLPPGAIAVDAIDVDQMYETGVPGLLAAGDVCIEMPSVANAIAAGSNAAAAVVRGVVAERLAAR